MKKITTLFKKDPNNLGLVINEVDEKNLWVFTDKSIPTRKRDGTACAIINGELYKRYDAKKGKSIPYGAIPCQEADLITGHHPHWIKCDIDNPSDKYHFEAFNNITNENIIDGTYELIGEKINGNKEKVNGHHLVKHGSDVLEDLTNFSFESIKEYLSKNDIEGIVFHSKNDDRMCKIRKSDFGFKW